VLALIPQAAKVVETRIGCERLVDPAGLVDCRPDQREVEPVPAADVAIWDLASWRPGCFRRRRLLHSERGNDAFGHELHHLTVVGVDDVDQAIGMGVQQIEQLLAWWVPAIL
jgi:hypothetical protein